MFIQFTSMTQSLSRLLSRFWVDQNAASTVEYSLLVALIAAVLFGVASYSGASLGTIFRNADAGLSSATPSGQNGIALLSDGDKKIGNSGSASAQPAPVDSSSDGSGSSNATANAIAASDSTASGADTGRFLPDAER